MRVRAVNVRQACRGGQIEHLNRWIAEGALSDAALSSPDSRGETALMSAARHGHHDCALAVLHCGAEVNPHDKDGDTALMIAADEGDGEMVALLLKAGAQPDLCNTVKDTALIEAAYRGHVECVRLLLAGGGDGALENQQRDTALTIAAHQGHQACVELLAIADAVNHVNKRGDTALMLAVDNQHTDCVRTLIEKGCNVDLASASGDTPLMLAVEKRASDCIQLLLDAGADPSVANAKGVNAVMVAVSHANVQCLQRLVDKGADLTVAHPYKGTVAEQALSKDLAMLEFLIDSGVDVNHLGDGPWALPLLHKAVGRGDLAAVKLLLRLGADVNKQCHRGRTPLQLSMTAPNASIPRLLLEHGADCNIGATLHACVHSTQHLTSHVKLLLEAGVDVNRVDGKGNTALMCAASRGQPELVLVLMDHGADWELQNPQGLRAIDLVSRWSQHRKKTIQALRGGVKLVKQSCRAASKTLLQPSQHTPSHTILPEVVARMVLEFAFPACALPSRKRKTASR